MNTIVVVIVYIMNIIEELYILSHRFMLLNENFLIAGRIITKFKWILLQLNIINFKIIKLLIQLILEIRSIFIFILTIIFKLKKILSLSFMKFDILKNEFYFILIELIKFLDKKFGIANIFYAAGWFNLMKCI